MLLNNQSNTLETNVDTSQSVDFSIGDTSTIISILRSKLYSHPIRTLVQEYICNARDAMREAGTWGKDTLQITLPSIVDHTFSVRDYGPGISPDRMANVFVRYGASTKRTDNNQTGGFGIGAKSAWSYTDSFTIETFIDGIRRSYVAHLGASNSGSLDLLATEATTEKNGTKVTIAVKASDSKNFRNAVNRAIYFWDEPVTVNGVALKRQLDVKQYEEMFCIEAYHDDIYRDLAINNTFLVIDGVIYEYYFQNYSAYVNTFLRFNTGEIEVSANRESIVESDKNKKSIQDKVGAFQAFVDDKKLAFKDAIISTKFALYKEFMFLTGQNFHTTNFDVFQTRCRYLRSLGATHKVQVYSPQDTRQTKSTEIPIGAKVFLKYENGDGRKLAILAKELKQKIYCTKLITEDEKSLFDTTVDITNVVIPKTTRIKRVKSPPIYYIMGPKNGLERSGRELKDLDKKTIVFGRQDYYNLGLKELEFLSTIKEKVIVVNQSIFKTYIVKNKAFYQTYNEAFDSVVKKFEVQFLNSYGDSEVCKLLKKLSTKFKDINCDLIPSYIIKELEKDQLKKKHRDYNIKAVKDFLQKYPMIQAIRPYSSDKVLEQLKEYICAKENGII